jgi:hypothetical protein
VGCGAQTCREGARTYGDGANWTCSDGCNICGCRDGVVGSTLKGCETPPGPAAGKLKCEEGNFWHTHGEIWKCSDGCDACGCDDGRLTREPAECSMWETSGGADGGTNSGLGGTAGSGGTSSMAGGGGVAESGGAGGQE